MQLAIQRVVQETYKLPPKQVICSPSGLIQKGAQYSMQSLQDPQPWREIGVAKRPEYHDIYKYMEAQLTCKQKSSDLFYTKLSDFFHIIKHYQLPTKKSEH